MIIKQREEFVSVECCLVPLGMLPFFIILSSLLFQIYFFVQCIVVELRLLDFILSPLSFVGLMEDVHYLYRKHNLLLCEYVSNNNQCNIVLEFLYGFGKLILGQAFCQEINDEFLIWFQLVDTHFE